MASRSELVFRFTKPRQLGAPQLQGSCSSPENLQQHSCAHVKRRHGQQRLMPMKQACACMLHAAIFDTGQACAATVQSKT